MAWVLVVLAIVGVWILLEKVFDRGFDELWDGIGRLFRKRPVEGSSTSRSSLVMRDDEGGSD